MTYKEEKKRIKCFAVNRMRDGTEHTTTATGLWFNMMKQKNHYIAGSENYVFSLIEKNNKIYMNRIY